MAYQSRFRVRIPIEMPRFKISQSFFNNRKPILIQNITGHVNIWDLRQPLYFLFLWHEMLEPQSRQIESNEHFSIRYQTRIEEDFHGNTTHLVSRHFTLPRDNLVVHQRQACLEEIYLLRV